MDKTLYQIGFTKKFNEMLEALIEFSGLSDKAEVIRHLILFAYDHAAEIFPDPQTKPLQRQGRPKGSKNKPKAPTEAPKAPESDYFAELAAAREAEQKRNQAELARNDTPADYGRSNGIFDNRPKSIKELAAESKKGKE